MSAIHFKFSSSNQYQTITFDGMYMSLFELKKAIMEKLKLKSTEAGLNLTNAQTLKEYKEDTAQIPKNSSILVRRVPPGVVKDDGKVYIVNKSETSLQQKPIKYSKSTQDSEKSTNISLQELSKKSDLATAQASEKDKLKAAIYQSSLQYENTTLLKHSRYTGGYRNNNQNVLCYRCYQPGHYSPQCHIPKNDAERPKPLKIPTGIPRSQMIEVSKDTKGAMIAADGKYVVPKMDKKGYDIGKKERPPFIKDANPETVDENEEHPVPAECCCTLCDDLLVDAVVISCCGNTFCDDCIRNSLLESENHQCPKCKANNVSPDTLVANKLIRDAVDRFRKSTGIIRKSSRRPVWPRPAAEFPVASTVSYNSAFKNRAVYESSKAVSKGYAVRTVTTQSQLLINNAVKKTAASEIQSLSPLNDTGKICLRIPSPPRDEYLLASSTTSDGISADSKIETAENNPASSDEKPSVTENSVASLDESASKPVLTDAKPPLECKGSDDKVEDWSSKDDSLTEDTKDGNAKIKVEAGIEQNDEKVGEEVVQSIKVEPQATSPVRAIQTIGELKVKENSKLNNEVTNTFESDILKDFKRLPPQMPIQSVSTSVQSLLGEPPIMEHLASSFTNKLTSATTTSVDMLSSQNPLLAQHLQLPNVVSSLNGASPFGHLLPTNLHSLSLPGSTTTRYSHPPPPLPFMPFGGLVDISKPPPGYPNLSFLPPPNLLPPVQPQISAPPINMDWRSYQRRRSPSPAKWKRGRSFSRSPRRRGINRSNKSKVDLMSEEFTERYSRRRYPPSRRRARSRSFSSDRSYSTRSKSLTPHSSSPASRSSRSSRSFSGSPKRGHRQQTSKPHRSKSGRNSSRSRSPANQRRRSDKRRKQSHRSPKRSNRRRNSRSMTPPRGSYRGSRRSPSNSRKHSRRSTSRSRNEAFLRANYKNRAAPSNSGVPISVLSAAGEEMQGSNPHLLKYFKLCYERDWLDKGIVPPPPYDQFCRHLHTSRSPSPPGTTSRLIPSPGSHKTSQQWPASTDPASLLDAHQSSSGLNPEQVREIRQNVINSEMYYEALRTAQPPPHPNFFASATPDPLFNAAAVAEIVHNRAIHDPRHFLGGDAVPLVQKSGWDDLHKRTDSNDGDATPVRDERTFATDEYLSSRHHDRDDYRRSKRSSRERRRSRDRTRYRSREREASRSKRDRSPSKKDSKKSSSDNRSSKTSKSGSDRNKTSNSSSDKRLVKYKSSSSRKDTSSRGSNDKSRSDDKNRSSKHDKKQQAAASVTQTNHENDKKELSRNKHKSDANQKEEKISDKDEVRKKKISEIDEVQEQKISAKDEVHEKKVSDKDEVQEKMVEDNKKTFDQSVNSKDEVTLNPTSNDPDEKSQVKSEAEEKVVKKTAEEKSNDQSKEASNHVELPKSKWDFDDNINRLASTKTSSSDQSKDLYDESSKKDKKKKRKRQDEDESEIKPRKVKIKRKLSSKPEQSEIIEEKSKVVPAASHSDSKKGGLKRKSSDSNLAANNKNQTDARLVIESRRNNPNSDEQQNSKRSRFTADANSKPLSTKSQSNSGESAKTSRENSVMKSDLCCRGDGDVSEDESLTADGQMDSSKSKADKKLAKRLKKKKKKHKRKHRKYKHKSGDEDGDTTASPRGQDACLSTDYVSDETSPVGTDYRDSDHHHVSKDAKREKINSSESEKNRKSQRDVKPRSLGGSSRYNDNERHRSRDKSRREVRDYKRRSREQEVRHRRYRSRS